MAKLIIEGIVEIEDHGWLYINQPLSSDFLAALLVKHFSPARLQSKYDREMLTVQKMSSLDGLAFDSPERRRIVEEIERLSEDYSNSFRVIFEPLANQGEKLTLEGDLVVEGAELSFESQNRNGFLGDILLEHFKPDLPSDEDLEDEVWVDLGSFRIVFEQIIRKT